MSRPMRVCTLMLLSAWTAAAVAQTPPQRFGRLFHSPEERLRLDREGSLEKPAPVQYESRSHRLDGIVRRADGQATVWVDGHRATAIEAHPTADARAAVIALPDGGKRRLRVGESVSTEDPK